MYEKPDTQEMEEIQEKVLDLIEEISPSLMKRDENVVLNTCFSILQFSFINKDKTHEEFKKEMLMHIDSQTQRYDLALEMYKKHKLDNLK